MSKNVTYLLGAGASANAIPIVSEMGDRIGQLIKFLNSVMNRNWMSSKEHYLYFIECLTKLKNDASIALTIDTLAKSYYLSESYDELNNLKRRLEIYFVLEQILSSTEKKRVLNYIPDNQKNIATKHYLDIDKRYGSFITTIAEKSYLVASPVSTDSIENDPSEVLSFKLKPNVKIISWNYDAQFELTLKKLFNFNIEKIKNNFNVIGGSKEILFEQEIQSVNNKFALVKLNGEANFDYSLEQSKFSMLNMSGDDINDLIIHLFESLGNKERKSYINFAWEADPNFHLVSSKEGHNNRRLFAEKVAEETDILVVIGYSFPLFNREIDKRLFDKMAKLSKIYIQDVNPQQIKSTIQSAFNIFDNDTLDLNIVNHDLKTVSFQLETNLNQFVIPYEL